MSAERPAARNRQALLLGLTRRHHLRPDAAGDAAGGGRLRSAVRHGGALAGGGGAGVPRLAVGAAAAAAAPRVAAARRVRGVLHHRLSAADGDRHAIRAGLARRGGAGRAAAADRHGRRAGGGRAPVARVLGLRTGRNRQRARLLAPRRRRFRRSALGRPAARRVRHLPRPWPMRSAARWRAASAAGR